jgi:hypothetical protein
MFGSGVAFCGLARSCWSGYLARRPASSHSAAQRHGILSPISRATPHKSLDYHATNADAQNRLSEGKRLPCIVLILHSAACQEQNRADRRKEFAGYFTFLLSHMRRLRVSPVIVGRSSLSGDTETVCCPRGPHEEGPVSGKNATCRRLETGQQLPKPSCTITLSTNPKHAFWVLSCVVRS